MRHGIALAAGLACVLATALGLDQLAARSPAPGVAWVLTRGPAAAALDGLLAGQDMRLLRSWAGGRIVQVHADAIGALRLPPRDHWLALRLPRGTLAWPACG